MNCTTMQIEISKCAIMDEVAKTSAYIGAKTQDYDRLAIIDQNEEMLERFWNECSAAVSFSLSTSIVGQSINQETVCFYVNIPETMLTSVRDTIVSYYVETILGKWLELSRCEEALLHINRAEAHLTRLIDMAFSAIVAVTRPLSPF